MNRERVGRGSAGALTIYGMDAAAVAGDAAELDMAAVAGDKAERDAVEAAPLRAAYRPRRPVDLRQTLRPLSRGTHDPTLRWQGSAVWRTLLTPDGPATLHLEQSD